MYTFLPKNICRSAKQLVEGCAETSLFYSGTVALNIEFRDNVTGHKLVLKRDGRDPLPHAQCGDIWMIIYHVLVVLCST